MNEMPKGEPANPTPPKKPSSGTSKANTLTVAEKPGVSRERTLTEVGLSSVVANTATARAFAKGIVGELDLSESVSVMAEKAQKVKAGDLTELEATLTAQAASLDAIYNELARRAALNMGEYMNATDLYLRLALKAQAQCRATIETLAEIKNPRPVAFVKQANIAHGHQQVNNGAASRAGISADAQNELLGQSDGERMDCPKTNAAGKTNQDLATMAAIDRASQRSG